ncbi:unnamed protein product, partial [Closterium sp. NIES-54]
MSASPLLLELSVLQSLWSLLLRWRTLASKHSWHKPSYSLTGGAKSEGAESGSAEPQGAALSGATRAGAGGAGGTEFTAGAGGTGGTAATGPGGARTRGTGAVGTGGVGGVGAGDPTKPRAAGPRGCGARAGGAGAGGTGARGAGARGAGVGGTGVGIAGAGGADAGDAGVGTTGAGGAGTEELALLTLEALCGRNQRRELASRPISPVRTASRVPRSRPPHVLVMHAMAFHPSSVPLRVPLPVPPESSLPEVSDPESDRAHAASPTVSHLFTTAITDPSFESAAASALVAEPLDFAAVCCLDYASTLVAASEFASPPSIRGECALGTDVLEERQEDFECLATVVPRFTSMLLALEGDPDASDMLTPPSYAEAITGPYSSQWQAAMDAKMASWKSTGTYVDALPPSRRDYELHSLDFNTAFLQCTLHEEIWLRRPPSFTESFPARTEWSLRRPVYGLRKAPREWHDTLRTTLAALGFPPSTADPSLFLRIDTSLPPFYVLVYVDDLVFATADTEALTLVNSELQKRHTYTDQVTEAVVAALGVAEAARVAVVVELDEVEVRELRLGAQLVEVEVLGVDSSSSSRVSSRPSRRCCCVSGWSSEVAPREEVAAPTLGAWSLRRRRIWQAGPRTYPCYFGRPLVGSGSGSWHHCSAVSGGPLRPFHLPSFAMKLVSDAVLQDELVTTITPGGELVAIFASCSCRLLMHPSLLWHHRLGHPSLQCLHCMHSRLLVSGLSRSLTLLSPSLEPPCTPYIEGRQRAAPHSSSFPPTTTPMQTLHMDVSSSGPVFQSQKEVGDASAFRVWGSLALVRDTTAGKLSSRTVRYVFLGFFTDAPGWQFYHLTARHVLSSRDITFDESVCYYHLLPHMNSRVPPPPLFLDPGYSQVDPHPPSRPSPSGVSQVTPPPLVEHLEVFSGLAEGGVPAADDTAASHHSPRLETPLGFPPRLSLPPLRHVAVDSGATPGGGVGGAGSEGADAGGAGSRGAEPGGAEPGGATPGGGAGSWGAEGGGAKTGGTKPGVADSGAGGDGGTRARVALPSPPGVPDHESGLARVAILTITRCLATLVTDSTFVSVASSALVTELVDFAAACRLDYFTNLTAMDAEMASWKSTGTNIDAVSPLGANIVEGIWIFRMKRPLGSPPVFKAHYVARGFSQRQGVDFFQAFSRTPKMTTLQVLMHVAAQRDYELHSLDFTTAFLQCCLNEEIWLRGPPGFIGSFPDGPSTFPSPQPTSPPTGHSLSAPPSDESVEPSGPYPELMGCLMYLMTCTRSDLAYPLSIPARFIAPGRHPKEHWTAAKRVLRYLASTSGMGLVLGGQGRVVLTGHSDASWADDQETRRSSQ